MKMDNKNTTKFIEIQLQLTNNQNDKKETKGKNRRKIKDVKNKTLDKDFFQKVVECENEILKGFNRNNLFEILELYKVIKKIT
jgi:hypothetical protein